MINTPRGPFYPGECFLYCHYYDNMKEKNLFRVFYFTQILE